MGLNQNRQRGARLVPNAVTVARDDPETIAARIDVVVMRDPPAAGLDPTRIHPFEHVFEAGPLRRLEIKGGIIEFQLAAPWRNGQEARGRVGGAAAGSVPLTRPPTDSLTGFLSASSCSMKTGGGPSR